MNLLVSLAASTERDFSGFMADYSRTIDDRHDDAGLG
jgi:hypothetical protein